MTERTIINIDDLPLKHMGNGDYFDVQIGRAGKRLGLRELGCSLHVLSPGKAGFPFHRHHVNDELFLILAGEGEYRFGDQRQPLRSGDLASAPAGTEAHQIINTSDADLRYLAFSSTASAEIVDYPDSNKVSFAAGMRDNDPSNATMHFLGRTQPADYYDGEG